MHRSASAVQAYMEWVFLRKKKSYYQYQHFGNRSDWSNRDPLAACSNYCPSHGGWNINTTLRNIQSLLSPHLLKGIRLLFTGAPDYSSLRMSDPSHIRLCVVDPSCGCGGGAAHQVGSQVSGRSLSRNLSPSGPSAHELRVALGARYYDIHPDPHGLRGRGHHVVEAVVGFHTEGQRRVRALEDRRRRERGDFLDRGLHLLHVNPQRHYSEQQNIKLCVKIKKKKNTLFFFLLHTKQQNLWQYFTGNINYEWLEMLLYLEMSVVFWGTRTSSRSLPITAS